MSTKPTDSQSSCTETETATDTGTRIGRTEELSDFQRGTIVGCHLSKKSVREISALLELPRSVVNDVIVKWKRLGITTPLPRSGRPQKLSNKDVQALENQSLTELTTEFQSASGRNVSPRTVRRELLNLTAAKRPKGAKRNAKPDLQPDNEKRKKVQEENAASSNDRNPCACEEDQGHLDTQTEATSEPTDQPTDAEASTTSHNIESLN